jgi:hypothetical protein
MGYGETQARAFPFARGGKKGIEDIGKNMLRYARAGIGDFNG